jgi:hypothetical protein
VATSFQFIGGGVDARCAGNDPLQFLRDVGLTRSIKDTRHVRNYHLPQFPGTLELKTGAELCCFSSGNTASRKFHAANRRHAPRAIAYSAGKPRINPVAELDAVIMLVKICVD